MNRLRFKASIEHVLDPNAGLFLLRERDNVWLPHPIYRALAPMLDGSHEVEDIFRALSGSFPPQEILRALLRLTEDGYLVEGARRDTDPSTAYWEQLRVPASLARARLGRASVSMLAFGDIDPAPLEDTLKRQGVRLSSSGEFAVVLSDDYLRPELGEWNTRCRATRTRWLLVKPVGTETWLGPSFTPFESACWECLAQRLRGHRRLEVYLNRDSDTYRSLGPRPARLASAMSAALADAATEVTRWIGTGGLTPLANCVVSTDLVTLERHHHTLVRRPQCPVCGTAESSARDEEPGILALTPRSKAHTSDGGHRVGDPGEIFERLKIHISPITGIVGRLEAGERTARKREWTPWLTPTFIADHNFANMHEDWFFLREGVRARSGGKGKSAEQARTSAVAESIERYCGVFDGTEPRVRGSYAGLGSSAIDPNTCMAFSARQYRERESLNARRNKAYWVPECFREDVEIDWTPLRSLTTGEMRYLPTSYCYYGYQSEDPVFARANSNGCAAGSVLEEAVLQGFLELVERDAVAIWWFNQLSRPGVDLDSSGDTYVTRLRDHYHSLRRDLWVLDLSSDLGVATFAALSRRVDGEADDIIYGFGAHLDPEVALTRALTELNQSLEAVPAATGPTCLRSYRGRGEAVGWWRTVRVADASYLAPEPQSPSRRLTDFAGLASGDLQQDISKCIGIVAKQGMEILVLDQTRPDIGMPVVRVVVPGLRHFWARFGPGRLYDVPVSQGWLAQPRLEEELNSYVVYF